MDSGFGAAMAVFGVFTVLIWLVSIAIIVVAIIGNIKLCTKSGRSWYYIFYFPIMYYVWKQDLDIDDSTFEDFLKWSILSTIIQAAVSSIIPFIGAIGGFVAGYFIRKKYCTDYYDILAIDGFNKSEKYIIFMCLAPALSFCWLGLTGEYYGK